MGQKSAGWYDAKLIVGAIDDAAFIAQPKQNPDPQKRLPLFQAMRDDLAGITPDIVETYRTVLDQYSRNMLFMSRYECWHWYIKWRLQELSATAE